MLCKGWAVNRWPVAGIIVRSRIATLLHAQFLRYLLASIGALAVDMGCFLGLLSSGAGPVTASAAGYALGIVAHWLLSSRAVFAEGVAERGKARAVQKAMFVSSALLGLAITTAIVGGGDALGIDPRFAKLVAICVSFIATWLVRSRIVFRPRTAV
jgi:putative flippase GtrA